MREGEDRRGRADAERECRDCGNGECRSHGQAPERQPQVLNQRLHKGQPSLVAVSFFDCFDASKLQHSLAACLGRRQAGAKIRRGFQRKMLLDFGAQPFFVLAGCGQGREPAEETSQMPFIGRSPHNRSSGFTEKKRAMMAAFCSQSRVSAASCLRPPRVSR